MRLRRICTALVALVFAVEAVRADEVSRLVEKSDDLEMHRAAFDRAATALIDAGVCTEQDFIEHGGWVKSMSYRPRAVYFMYCGEGTSIRDRLYLDAKTGEMFR